MSHKVEYSLLFILITQIMCCPMYLDFARSRAYFMAVPRGMPAFEKQWNTHEECDVSFKRFDVDTGYAVAHEVAIKIVPTLNDSIYECDLLLKSRYFRDVLSTIPLRADAVIEHNLSGQPIQISTEPCITFSGGKVSGFLLTPGNVIKIHIKKLRVRKTPHPLPKTSTYFSWVFPIPHLDTASSRIDWERLESNKIFLLKSVDENLAYRVAKDSDFILRAQDHEM